MANYAHSLGSRMFLAKTCTRCDRLLGPAHYRRMTSRNRWLSQCNSCTAESARIASKASYDRSKAEANREGVRWTESEYRTLRAMYGRCESHASIAKTLGRTTMAVKAALKRSA